MKRNQYGINFDLGVPLESEEDFGKLYIDLFQEKKLRLVKWIQDKKEGSIIVAGQIGSGKTTFINKAFKEALPCYDISIKLDTEVPFLNRGAFWGVFLGNVLKLCQQLGIDVSQYKMVEDLLKHTEESIGLDLLINRLMNIPSEISDFGRKKSIYHIVDEHLEVIKFQLAEMITRIEEKQERKLFVFIDGIDKFKIHKPEYYALEEFLVFLKKYKTLYEANFIHLVGFSDWHHAKKIWLTSISNEEISWVLEKRLGVYVETVGEMLPLLVNLSGGNLRQGLRLLVEYYDAHRNGKAPPEALDFAARRVRNDLLDVLEGSGDSELLTVVERDGYISSSVLQGIKERDMSENAIYQNRILLKEEGDHELKWPAIVNPLLLPGIKSFEGLPESPETTMIKKWAEDHDVSPFGLDFDTTKVNRSTFFDTIYSSGKIKTMNVFEILENMASYFLNTERRDKIIITYQDIQMAHLANDYLVGKAGTFNPGAFKDIEFKKLPLDQLQIYLKSHMNGGYEGFSIFFEKELREQDILELDRKRDTFLNYKMIWWIQKDHLIKYLKYWTQLRQFLKIFRLEQDMLSTLSKEEIEEDLESLEILDATEDVKHDLNERLKKVLNALKSRKYD
jgi:hypothetical protein